MGQVRDHISSDGPALAEWVARKLHNHNPMRIRSGQRGAETQKTHIAFDHDTQKVFYMSADGQVFEIEVRALGARAELAPETETLLKDRSYSYSEWHHPKQRAIAS